MLLAACGRVEGERPPDAAVSPPAIISMSEPFSCPPETGSPARGPTAWRIASRSSTHIPGGFYSSMDLADAAPTSPVVMIHYQQGSLGLFVRARGEQRCGCQQAGASELREGVLDEALSGGRSGDESAVRRRSDVVRAAIVRWVAELSAACRRPIALPERAARTFDAEFHRFDAEIRTLEAEGVSSGEDLPSDPLPRH